jgi:quinolinate synthase
MGTVVDKEQLMHEIRRLARERNAVILAHNYQISEIQEVADYVGDSLGLSMEAAKTSADVIVFCGVHFMAETASILCPDKIVLIPDLEAGCSLAQSINAEQLAEWKKRHPNAVVVSYVNTSAEVKALSDYCCTSANAVKVVKAIPDDKEILFLPDLFLGTYVQKVTGRKMHIWPGECHVHAGIRPSDVDKRTEEFPDADLLIHPECGCSSPFMYYASDNDLKTQNIFFLSTEGMTRHARNSAKNTFLVATEVGMLHRLRKENPEKRFIPVAEEALCKYMKMITVEKLYESLRDLKYEVKVPDDIANRARLAIERMISIV